MWKNWILASFVLLSHSDWYMLYLKCGEYAALLLIIGGEIC